VTRRILSVFGTRPEAIKMAPVVLRLAEEQGLESAVCVTAQHRELLDPVLELFGIRPAHDLAVMRAGQDLFDVTSRALLGLRDVLAAETPDRVLVHGDTTTCLTAALAAFYAGVPVAHVEAGLRTGDLLAPWPEEMNRTVVDRIADLLFAPTEGAREKLLREGLPAERIHVTGNTVVDALLWARERVANEPAERWREAFGGPLCERLATADLERLVLITGHRRESFGRGFEDFCGALRELAARHADWLFVWPLHKNPNARRPAQEGLAGLPNVLLLEALDYAPFVWLMDKADLIVTDSGGIQEEAPVLGKPVLVTRAVTERPEALSAGAVRLVGTDPRRIVAEAERVLGDPELYARMTQAGSPYGDGRAAERIVRVLAAE
jgi:UDP-N-acetylglucosamine 2-epimerase (non-hydrolysing)